MAAPKLVLRKRMLFIQGKVRPTCFAQAAVDTGLRAVLDEHFLNETLFKRAAYANAWPEGALSIPPALSPALNNFLKNDACPEITVKTLLAGQLHQGATAWEMLCFEFIAKLAFENFVTMCCAASELDQELVYVGELAHLNLERTADAAIEQLKAIATEMAAEAA